MYNTLGEEDSTSEENHSLLLIEKIVGEEKLSNNRIRVFLLFRNLYRNAGVFYSE